MRPRQAAEGGEATKRRHLWAPDAAVLRGGRFFWPVGCPSSLVSGLCQLVQAKHAWDPRANYIPQIKAAMVKQWPKKASGIRPATPGTLVRQRTCSRVRQLTTKLPQSIPRTLGCDMHVIQLTDRSAFRLTARPSATRRPARRSPTVHCRAAAPIFFGTGRFAALLVTRRGGRAGPTPSRPAAIRRRRPCRAAGARRAPARRRGPPAAAPPASPSARAGPGRPGAVATRRPAAAGPRRREAAGPETRRLGGRVRGGSPSGNWGSRLLIGGACDRQQVGADFLVVVRPRLKNGSCASFFLAKSADASQVSTPSCNQQRTRLISLME